ncbi:MAG: glycosyltransferase [Desulfosoma sp.]
MRKVFRDCQPVVFWKAPIYDPSGYGDEARHLIKAIQHGWPLRVEPVGRFSSEFIKGMNKEDRELFGRLQKTALSKEYINLDQVPAYAFHRDERAIFNIGRTVFETDRIPASWVEKCDEMDEIWVPTPFNVETFLRSGVRTPIHVVPQGIDSEFFRPGFKPLLIPGKRSFAFLSVFEWTYRKGWDLLLKAWAEVFAPHEDVCLILRTYPINAVDSINVKYVIHERIHQFLQRQLGASPFDIAPIIVLGDQIPAKLMPRLYATADAFVLPSRGEGWGRPYMEAMACGLPAIGTRWGGNLAFMNDKNSYLVEINGLEEVGGEMEFEFYRGHLWASPSLDSLKTQLRHVYEHSAEARSKALQARVDVVKNWSWEAAANKALDRLEAITSYMPRSHFELKGMTSLAQENSRVEVVWEGPQLVYSSLANINREICLNLSDRQEVFLSLIPKDYRQLSLKNDINIRKLMRYFYRSGGMNPCVHVRHEWPPNFTPPERGHWVMIQHWEYGRLPYDWVKPMSTLVDELWVPSRHVWKTYVSSGVPPERLHFLPLGINPNTYNQVVEPLPLKTKKTFKFLFVGGTIWRKGIDVLLTAYRNVFTRSDDVTLVVKDFGQNSFYKGQGLISAIQALQKDPRAPEILYIDEDLDESLMPRLYKACNCLVHPYRGEGFGMPVLEAMACGVPVIVTEGGATDDFCKPEFTYKIKATRRAFTAPTIQFASGAGWVLEPDLEELQKLLLHVYENFEEAKQKAQTACDHVLQHYNWKRITDLILARICLLVQKPIARFRFR